MVCTSVAKQLITLAHVIEDVGLKVTMTVGGVPSPQGGAREPIPTETSTWTDPALVDPCAMRMVLMSLRSRGDRLDDVVALELDGPIIDTGGGLFLHTPTCHRRNHDADENDGVSVDSAPPGQHWWFATTLAPRLVLDVLQACESGPEQDAVNARLSIDSELQTCAVSIFANTDGFEAEVERVAQWCFRQCVVDELITPTATAWVLGMVGSEHGRQTLRKSDTR